MLYPIVTAKMLYPQIYAREVMVMIKLLKLSKTPKYRKNPVKITPRIPKIK
jgi:hypothetical protein